MKRYGYFLDLLKLDIEKYPVIAVVGGGGKTSLIYRLNEELQALGKKVIISTTTHMAYDPMLPLVKSTCIERVPEILKEHGFAVVADEIRSLAEMTKSSTEEITQIMNALITLTNNTQNELKHTVDSINIQRGKVKTVHESFVTVEQDIDSLVANMTSVSSEVNAVLDANSSIVDGIETLSGISQEMSSTTETTRQEMHDLNNRITSFSDAINTTSESLERLRKTSAVDNTED